MESGVRGGPARQRDMGLGAGMGAGLDAELDARLGAGLGTGLDARLDSWLSAGLGAGLDAGLSAGLSAVLSPGLSTAAPTAPCRPLDPCRSQTDAPGQHIGGGRVEPACFLPIQELAVSAHPLRHPEHGGSVPGPRALCVCLPKHCAGSGSFAFPALNWEELPGRRTGCSDMKGSGESSTV